MQLLFIILFSVSAIVILHDNYSHSLLTNQFPWGHILLNLIGISFIFIPIKIGVDYLAKFMAFIAFCISLLYETTIRKYSPNTIEVYIDFALWIFLKALVCYLLYFSAKNIILLSEETNGRKRD